MIHDVDEDTSLPLQDLGRPYLVGRGLAVRPNDRLLPLPHVGEEAAAESEPEEPTPAGSFPSSRPLCLMPCEVPGIVAGPVLTLAHPRILSPPHTGHVFLMRAGLSRRQLGWRGDLCAGVPAAPGAGVPLFRLVEPHLEEFLRVYPERFAKQHGPLRPVVERVRRGFLTCGLVEHGFARLWCGTCRTSVLCPFSCRGRSFCPSCEKKKQLRWAEWLHKEVLEPVPHRHVVLTMPRLRGIFRKRRELLLDHLGLSPPEEPPPDVREVVRVPVDDQGREIGASPA
jgi:hypothetical protein